jgi:GMP synthase (glutamine-hydrolysing)
LGELLGIQLASLVAGGEVAVNPRGREWGIARDIRLTDAARTSPMLAGKPVVFDAFIMHLDEVTRLPGGTPLLATNTHTPIQAAVIEDGEASFWSTQYHPEYNLYEMARLIAARAKALVREGFFPDDAAVATYAARMKELSANPDSAGLRTELDVGDDIIDPQIRELELRNWLRFIDARAGVRRAATIDRPATTMRS